MYQGVPATPPRLSAFWEAARARLDGDAAMQALLGGAGRVNLSYEAPWPGLGENRQWTRVVLVPVTRAYPVSDSTGASVLAPFLVRADLHAPGGAVPIYKGELVHLRAFALLHGWLPGDLEDVSVHHRVWRETAPEPVPLRDPDSESGLSFMSAEYRALLESPDV